MLVQVLFKVAEAFDVLIHFRTRRIGNKHHCVRSLQDELPSGVVVNLAWHGVQEEARTKSADISEFER